MIDKKELKKLMYFAKVIHGKRILKKIKSIKDKPEKIETLKYTIRSRLDRAYCSLEMEIKNLKEKGKDVFFLDTKLRLLKPKINLFIATYNKKDFNNLIDSLNNIKKELNYV